MILKTETRFDVKTETDKSRHPTHAGTEYWSAMSNSAPATYCSLFVAHREMKRESQQSKKRTTIAE